MFKREKERKAGVSKLKVVKGLKKMTVYICLTTIIAGTVPVGAEAGNFTHRHTGACDKQVTKTCVHFNVYGAEHMQKHCEKCGTIKTALYEGYTESCPLNMVNSVHKFAKMTCTSCGTVLDRQDVSPAGSHTYTVTERKCGVQEGSVAATVSVSVDNTGWTNKNVNISCNVSISDRSFGVSSISFSGGGSGASASVSENGSYSFTVKGNNGQTVTESVTVSNIDKVAPTISLSKSTENWTESGLSISAVASDDLSGVAGFSFNGGGYSSGNSWNVTSNGTYSVSVIDNAGNVAGASITVSNIGKDPKVIEEEKRREEEEKRKKEEEERKRKEEEERKRREEEEKKRREEEEKKKQEEDKKKEDKADDKKGDDTRGDNDTSSGGGEGKKEEGLTEKEKDSDEKNNPFGSLFGGDDTGKDDENKDEERVVCVSGNDNNNGKNGGIGKKITVNEVVEDKPMATVVNAGTPVGSTAHEATGRSVLSIMKGYSVWFLFAGSLLFLAALMVFANTTFIYCLDDKKLKLVSTARLKIREDAIYISIDSGRLEKKKKYNIFYSLPGRVFSNQKKVVFDSDGKESYVLSSDRKSFVYYG